MKNYRRKIRRVLFPTFALMMAGMLVSCDKERTASAPELSVTASKTTVTEGEPVRFYLNGHSDYLPFFSGEDGSSYDYHDIPRVYPASLNLSFSTRLEGGNQLSDILSVKYSSDFSGEYTREAVRAATWTDITDKFTIPSKIESTQTPSGTLDMSEIFSQQQEVVFLAFDYKVAPFTGSNDRTVVYIYDFAVNAVSEIGVSTVMDQSTVNWQMVRFGEGFDEDAFGPNNNATRLCLKCSPQPAAEREVYAISPAIKPASEVNMGPDTGVTLKSYVDEYPGSHEYTFDRAGEYDVTFVAVNGAVNGRKQKTVTIRVKVDPAADTEAGGETVPSEKEEW